MNLELNVNVTVGVTPEVAAIATAILNRQGKPAAIEATQQEAPKAPAEAPEQPAPAKRVSREKKEAPAADPAVAPETPEPAGDMPEEVFYPSEEDVRAAMDKTRQRIEGEDYKNNTSSEAYTKYHKRLTAVFKSIAVQLGSEKPSVLPPEKRQDFIDVCALLVLTADGNITNPNAQ